MRRVVFSAIVAFIAVFSAGAQSIDPVVEVNSKYNVDLGEIHKPTLDKTVDDTLNRFNVVFDYLIYDRPFQNLYEFAPYDYTQVKHQQTTDRTFLYANVGCQTGIIPTANLAVQAVAKNNFAAGLYGNFKGWGSSEKVSESGYNQFMSRYKTDFGADMKYAWTTGETKIDANYRIFNDSFFYTDHHSGKFTLTANVNSANVEDNSIEYDFKAQFHNLNLNYFNDNMKERMLCVDGNVGTTFDIHRVYVDINVQSASYSEERAHNAWIVEFAPMYQYSKGRFFGKFGVRFGSRFSGKVEDDSAAIDHKGSLTNIFPVVDAKYTVVKDHLWIHALANGSNDMNSLESIVKKSPIVSTYSELRFGHTPIDAALKLESNVAGFLSLNFTGGYSLSLDKMIVGKGVDYLEDGRSFANAVATYWDIQRLYGGVDMKFNFNHFSFGGNVVCNTYKDWYEGEKLDVLPGISADAFVNFDVRDRLIASLRCNYANSTVFLPEVIDLGVNFQYIVNKHFSVYLKGENLLNKDLYYSPLYVEPGINLGGGITVHF